MIETTVQGAIASYSYAGIFLWFIFFDQLTPIPEEVSLITIGYLAASGIVNPIIACIVSFIGMLAVDIAFYILAARGSRIAVRLRSHMERSGFVQRIAAGITKHATRTLFILAFIPRVRFFSPLLAAASGISWKKFVTIDALANIVLCSVSISLGVLFKGGLELVTSEYQQLEHVLFATIMAILAVAAVLWLRKKYLL